MCYGQVNNSVYDSLVEPSSPVIGGFNLLFSHKFGLGLSGKINFLLELCSEEANYYEDSNTVTYLNFV